MKFLHSLIFGAGALLVQWPFVTCTAAETPDDLLPVEKAFSVDAQALDGTHIRLDFKLAEHYYLYRDRIKVTSTAGAKLGALELPAGEKKHDEFLGDVEVYHTDFAAIQSLQEAAGTAPIELAVRYQGCHEVDPKICYPPHTSKFSVAMQNAAATGDNPVASGLRIESGTNPGAGTVGLLAAEGAPLAVDRAFVFEAIAGDANQILARFTMPKGYYLYRDKTTFALGGNTTAKLGAARWPAGVSHADANMGATTVYFDQVDVPIALDRNIAASDAPVELIASFQGCRENSVCYPLTQRSVHVNFAPEATESNGKVNRASTAAAPEITNPVATTAVAATLSNTMVAAQTRPAEPIGEGSLFAALLAALLGGLVLNLMPCVLPVLSLKALSILEGGESPQVARKHVLYYTAGILVSFAVVGLAVILLRKAGLAYGWGFQLQHPMFVAVLVYVIVVIGLSMSGLFQFGAGLAGAGQQLTTRSGAAGDFFTGVLAVVVASPCTAPFMGSALAFALASSTFAALAIFLALGVGLALPFLLIGFIPGLSRFLPRPGAWMETLKQLLAFPMYLTAVWLIWVLGQQYGVNGVDAVGLTLIGVIALTLGLWWYERSRYDAIRWRSLAFVAMLLALPSLYALSGLEQKSSARTAVSGQTAFNPTKLAELRKSGKPVFVDIGADWCTTCKVNEHAVLATAEFRELVKRTDATLMVGDWTNPDPDIEAFLAQFHAVGVPLYVVFRNGNQGQMLSTVLTQGTVQAALEGSLK